MADVNSQLKKTPKPLRLMGAKSTTVEGQILYYEYGTFTVANAATTGELATSLTNVVIAIITPMNAAGVTGAAFSDNTLTSGKITITTSDPGATAQYAYMLIGTVETV